MADTWIIRLIRMSPSAGTVLVDDQRRVLLLWRHRLITGRWAWEIRIGRIDQDETPAEAAARKVEETDSGQHDWARRL